MKEKLAAILLQVVKYLGVTGVIPKVEHTTDLSHGDYTTNVAMVLAKHLRRNPLEIAEEIVEKIKNQKSRPKADQPLAEKVKSGEQYLSTEQSGQKGSDLGVEKSVLQDIERIEVAAPGFINFYLSASALSTELAEVLEKKESYGRVQKTKDKIQKTEMNSARPHPDPLLKGEGKETRKVMVEFAHPNTHKSFHIGHLRNISIGESIVRLLEAVGHKVIRANYQGDVGMHIAKALYPLLQNSELRTSREPGSRLAKLDPAPQDFARQISELKGVREKAEFLGKVYAEGSKAYEDDPQAKEKIHDINFLVYAAAQRFHEEKGKPKSSTDYLQFVRERGDEVDRVYELWKETRQWSLDYFEEIYKRVGTYFDRLYFESECLRGVDLAKDAVKKGVLEESDGAIIFRGEQYGLDTRVFVNSLGLPTYEGKELALSSIQFKEYGHLDKLIHVLGPEQVSFTKVTFKVEELLGIQKDQQYHLVYGWVRLKHGKMSSRLGNVVLGEDLLEEAKKAVLEILNKSSDVSLQSSEMNSSQPHRPHPDPLLKGEGKVGERVRKEMEEIAEKAAVAAVKYSFLKVSTLNEIAYDVKEAVNINGDSGPYLQYTYARCQSVLRKSGALGDVILSGSEGSRPKAAKNDAALDSSSVSGRIQNDRLKWNQEETLVLRMLYRFPEIVRKAALEYSPSLLCSYLYDLASFYNTFYNKHSILGSAKENSELRTQNLELRTDNSQQKTNFRLGLTSATAQVLKNGLYLLGIEVLEKM